MTAERKLTASELIGLGRDLERLADTRGPLEVLTERVANMAHGPMVFALSQHGLRLGRVVLDLYEQDMHLEAMPLVRSLYEAALTAQWMAQSREAPGAWFNEDVRLRRALAGDMRRSASQVFQEGASQIAHLDANRMESVADEQARHFSHLCETLRPGGAHAYVLYRIMSSYSHPSSTLMDHYVDQNEEQETGVTIRREPRPLGHDAWLFITVASMMWGARAVDMMHRDRPHREYLRSVARELGVPDVLQLSPEAHAAEAAAERRRRRAKWRGPRKRKR